MKKSGNSHIGKRIKKIRSFNGLTQEELAKAINKTRSMVSHIERTGEINYYTLKDIAKVLNLPVEHFQDGTELTEKHLIAQEPFVQYGANDKDNLLLEQLQNEINYLKSVIENQWKLLFELSK